jgi:hypothetical protein
MLTEQIDFYPAQWLLDFVERAAEYRRWKALENPSDTESAAAAAALRQLAIAFRTCVTGDLCAQWAEWAFDPDTAADAMTALSAAAWAVGVTSHPADADAFLTTVLAGRS